MNTTTQQDAPVQEPTRLPLDAGFFATMGFNDTNGNPEIEQRTAKALADVKELGKKAQARLAAAVEETKPATYADGTERIGRNLSWGDGGNPFARATAPLPAGVAVSRERFVAAPSNPVLHTEHEIVNGAVRGLPAQTMAGFGTPLSEVTNSQAQIAKTPDQQQSANNLTDLRETIRTGKLPFLPAAGVQPFTLPGEMVLTLVPNTSLMSIAIGTRYGAVYIYETTQPDHPTTPTVAFEYPQELQTVRGKEGLEGLDRVRFVTGRETGFNIGEQIESGELLALLDRINSANAEAPLGLGDGLNASSATSFERNFDRIVDTVEFSPSWMTDDKVALPDDDAYLNTLKPGAEVRCMTADGRKVIVFQTFAGPVAVYQRYPNGTTTIACHVPEAIIDAGSLRSNPLRLSEDDVRVLLGDDAVGNLGSRLNKHFNTVS